MECPQCNTDLRKLSHDVLWCPACGVAEVDIPEPYNWCIPEYLSQDLTNPNTSDAIREIVYDRDKH